MLKVFLSPLRILWWAITFQLGRRLQFRRDYRLVAESGLFDPDFYSRENHKAAEAGIDPLRHYLTQGAPEGCDPHPLFNTHWYLTQSRDAAASVTNPLLHYLTQGWKLGYNPHPLFDGNWYLRRNPDLAPSEINPLVHYVRQGWREGRDPHPLFDPEFYLERNPDVAKSGVEPLTHYALQGGFEKRDPHPLFDTGWYLSHYPDQNRSREAPLIRYLLHHSTKSKSPHPLFDAEYYVIRHADAAASEMDPLMHYMTVGAERFYSPHPLFDAEFYVTQGPLADAGFLNPLQHYIQKGAVAGMDPCELFDSSFYLEQYRDVRESGLNPLAHFWTKGAMNGYDPNPLFDTSFYLKQYPAVVIAGINPLIDFINYGARKGRFPNPFFDPLFYLMKYPDVERAGRNPLAHYLTSGAEEGRDPSRFFNTTRYVSEHPDLKESNINPLAHFLGYSNQVSPLSGDLEEDFSAAAVLLPTGMSEDALPKSPNSRAVPPGKSLASVNEVFRNASEAGGHLLILLGPLKPDKQVIRQLIESFSVDPHFGVAIPRQRHPVTGEILKLGKEQEDPAISVLPPEVLTEIPRHYILPEVLSSCFVIRDSVVSNLGCLDESYETLAGSLQQYLTRARRCGFRCVVVNDAVVSASPDKSSWLVPIKQRDLVRAHTDYPDIGEAELTFTGHPLHRHESLLARALSPKQSTRKSLLLDARGVPPKVNGTTEAVLGVCDGLRRLKSGWAITLLATPETANYHNLSKRYPDWEIIDETSDQLFTAALRPSQPWDLNSVIELHRKALFSFYTILDTIAWDILYGAPHGLGTTWNFLSSYADGILYISNYTRERFAIRFPQAKVTPGHVSYLSLNPRDYQPQAEANVPLADEQFILVVGNSYDHKNVGPTVDLLVSRFPGHRIKAFGLTAHASPLVDCLESGALGQSDVDLLFARASIVIFPSLYEGFGFPVLKGLSNGRTVIAPHSELLHEIAARYRGPGRLIGFHDPKELAEAVERVIHRLELAEISLGTALINGEEPSDWKDIARGILQFVEDRVGNLDQCGWQARQNAIELIQAGSR